MSTLKKYNVIYADPPWQYNQKQVGRGNKSGAVGIYKVMTIDDIKALAVKEIVKDDSLLFMWATVPLLPVALSVIPAWGLNIKPQSSGKRQDCLVWVTGLGFKQKFCW